MKSRRLLTPARTTILCALVFSTMAVSSCKQEAEADSVVAPANAPPSMVDAAILPDGAPPQPLHPLAGTVAPVDDAHANATSPALIPKAPGAALPATLTFKDAPVNPLCFTQTWEQPAQGAVIDLTACETPAAVRSADQSSYKATPGAHGVAYRPADATVETMPMPAIIEYKYLGDVGTDHAVLLSESGGGTGFFTSLYLLKRDGDRLIIKDTLAGGDRCNNGITAAAVNDGALSYDVNLTPAALYTLAGGDNTAERPGGPLKDCAVCCYATAHYKGGTLDTVTFNPDLAAALNPDEPGTAGCFDGIAQQQFTTRQTTMASAGLKDFGTRIYDTCFSPASTATP